MYFDVKKSIRLNNWAFLLQNTCEILNGTSRIIPEKREEKISKTLEFLFSAFEGFKKLSNQGRGLTPQELDDSFLITEAFDHVNSQYEFSLEMSKVNQAIKYLEQYNLDMLNKDDLESAKMLFYELTTSICKYSRAYSKREG